MSTRTIIKDAEKFCADHGHRYTDPRRFVLKIISESKKTIGAYDILSALGKYLDNPKPPTAYRAIDFWVEHGFVHRIESMNAFTLCREDHHHNGSQFLICDGCGDVTETHLCHVPDSLQLKAAEKNFTVENWTVELHGQCGHCTKNA